MSTLLCPTIVNYIRVGELGIGSFDHWHDVIWHGHNDVPTAADLVAYATRNPDQEGGSLWVANALIDRWMLTSPSSPDIADMVRACVLARARPDIIFSMIARLLDHSRGAWASCLAPIADGEMGGESPRAKRKGRITLAAAYYRIMSQSPLTWDVVEDVLVGLVRKPSNVEYLGTCWFKNHDYSIILTISVLRMTREERSKCSLEDARTFANMMTCTAEPWFNVMTIIAGGRRD